MLNMIIIDDERLIRNGLMDYLDWKALDIEIKAVCANGLEGLDAIHTHIPDIVLTDIAMPDMDGVELLKKVRSEGFGGQFIFISSYSEFRYAQEAIKYGAFDYLLKPLEASVLEDSIRRCIATIQNDSTSSDSVWDSLLACDLLQGALSGMPHAEESLLTMLKRADSPYTAPELAVGIWTKTAPSLSGNHKEFISCMLPPQCIALVTPNHAAFMQLQATETATVWRSHPCGENMHLLLCKCLLSLWLDDHADILHDPSALSPAAWLNDLRKAAASALASDMNLPSCWSLCRELLSTLQRQIERICPVSGMSMETAENSALNTGATQVFELFERTYQAGLQMLSILNTADSLAPYTRKVIAMIEKQYGKSLSLGYVAKNLGISKSHLSATFKADTGCTFGDYLFSFRMKIAKELLEENEYKIYEIAEKVGYPDLAQFSKRFKQYYGISPREMQKIL